MAPVVHMDTRGRALVAWLHEGSGEMFYAWREPRSRFTRPRRLAGGGSPWTYPERSIALSPNGVATAGYLAPDNRIGVVRALPGKPFGVPRWIGPVGTAKYAPEVAADDEGRAVLAWEDRSGEKPRIMTSLVSENGALSEPVHVGDGTGVDVAMSPASAAVVTWVNGVGQPEAAVRPPEGEFLPAAALPLPAGQPLAGIDAAGRALVASNSFQPIGPGTKVASFTVADERGRFGEQIRLDAGGTVNQSLAQPDGSVAIAFTTDDGSVMLTTRRSNGTIVGPDAISTESACAPHLSVARGGDLLATWVGPCSGSGYSSYVTDTFVSLRPEGRNFRPPAQVGLRGVQYPRGAITDGGEAVVVYRYSKNGTIHAVVHEDRDGDPLPGVPEIDIDVPDEMYLPDLPDIELPVRCARACKLTPSGLLHAGEETLATTSRSSSRLRAKRRAKLKVPFGGDARKAAEQAAAAGKPVWASVSVLVRGKSPRPQTVTRRIELRRGR